MINNVSLSCRPLTGRSSSTLFFSCDDSTIIESESAVISETIYNNCCKIICIRVLIVIVPIVHTLKYTVIKGCNGIGRVGLECTVTGQSRIFDFKSCVCVLTCNINTVILCSNLAINNGYIQIAAIVVEGNTKEYEFCNLEKVLEEPGVQIRIFGKPEIAGHRRVGVILATADTVEEALAKAERAYAKLEVKVY